MKKKASLSTVAAACSVSVSAAALAFSAPHKLSSAVRDAVLEEAVRQGYFAQKRVKVNKIAMVFDRFRNFYMGEYYHDVVFGLLSRLEELKFSAYILDSFEVDYSEVYDCAGILFVGRTPEPWIERAKKLKIPFVVCGHPPRLSGVKTIMPDVHKGFSTVLDFIISCGHTHIGLITGEADLNDPLRLTIIDAYRTALEKAGIAFREKNIVPANYGDIQSLVVAFNKMVSLKPRITAIQCADDVFAYLALQEAERNGISVPRDLSIAGFDGTSLPWFLKTPQQFLTTVWVDAEGLGRKAVDLLLERLQQRGSSGKIVLTDVKLLARGSVKRLR